MGNFSAENIISVNANGAISVYAIDIDGDGDNDVLSASLWDNKIAWYENDGTGNFSAENVISTNAIGAASVYSIDIDGDGDNDVLSASTKMMVWVILVLKISFLLMPIAHRASLP